MRTGMFKRLPILLCLLIMLLSVTGVYATWEYGVPPDSTTGDIQVGIGLPNYEEEGNSHTALLGQLVGSDYGLNNKDKGNTNGNYLLRQIEYRQEGNWLLFPSRDTLGSMAISQGETLDNIFGTKAANLEFLIYFRDRDNNVSVSEYYIFTWDKPLSDKNGNEVTAINKTVYPIYRTRVSKNSAGVWEQHESVTGYATTAYYEESRWDADKSKILSIEPDSFVEGMLN